jgi:hypothetical protein
MERDHLQEKRIDWRIILKWGFRSRMGAWNGMVWLIIWTGGGLL